MDIFQLIKDKGIPSSEGFKSAEDYLSSIMAESGRMPFIVGSGADFSSLNDALARGNTFDIDRTLVWPYGNLFDNSPFMIIDDEEAVPGGGESNWLSPTSYYDISTIPHWVNPINAYASDNAYTTSVDTLSDYREIHYKNFGFSIPVGATITGIEVRIDCYWSCTGTAFPWSPMNSVRLDYNGSALGVTTDKYPLIDWPHDSEGTIIVGGNGDTWGRTWTYSEFDDGNFEVYIAVKRGYGTGTMTFYIDWVRVKVYYTT